MARERELKPPAALALVEQSLAALAPPPLGWAAAPVADHMARLFPEEAALVAGAVPVRLHGFSTGRLVARRALAAAGHEAPVGPILARGRAPLPPPGWVLSISHADNIAVAVACRAGHAVGLGLDIERIDRMKPALTRYVARSTDRFPADVGPVEIALGFSLRESLFKALDPAGQQALRRIDLGWADGRIEAAFEPTSLARPQHRTAVCGEHVLTLALRRS